MRKAHGESTDRACPLPAWKPSPRTNDENLALEIMYQKMLFPGILSLDRAMIS
jgi:hypothetical protein